MSSSYSTNKTKSVISGSLVLSADVTYQTELAIPNSFLPSTDHLTNNEMN